MLVLPAAIQTNLDAGNDSSRLLAKFALDGGDEGIWSDSYDITVDSVLYLGIAGNIEVEAFPSAANLSIETVVLRMSNLDSDVNSLIDSELWHQRGVTLYVGHLDDTGDIISAIPRFSGFMDSVSIVEQANGLSVVLCRIESNSREFVRTGTHTRSDPDQRRLGGTLDGFFKHTAQSVTQPIFWGRKGPQNL